MSKTTRKKSFQTAVRTAQSALDSGDPALACKHLEIARTAAANLSQIKAVERASEESSTGSCQKAEAILDALAMTFQETKDEREARQHVNIMKTKTRKTTLPKSYDAGECDAGKSIGFKENLTPEQVAAVFSKHKTVMHIETPAGYFLRNEDGLLEGNPYTITQVIANLMEAENQLRKFPCNLTSGAGWVRNQLRAIVKLGIGPDFQSTLEAVNKLAQQNRLAVFDIKTKKLAGIKSEGGWHAACQNGDSIQINLQR